jgi:hypothetical protein
MMPNRLCSWNISRFKTEKIYHPDYRCPSEMELIWIIGMGHFGFSAYRRLRECNRNRHFVLVDTVEARLRKCQHPAATLAVADGPDFCQKHLNKGRPPDWIIPALPSHLAAEWLLLNLGPQNLRRIPPPPEMKPGLPNPMFGDNGDLYVSHAAFRCPDDCDEPREICTMTREVRKPNMYELLGDLHFRSFKSLNIRSRQLGPGIGGYRPEHLLELRDQLKRVAGPVLVSTACRCHGVITCLERL